MSRRTFMIELKSKEDIEGIRKSGALLSSLFKMLDKNIKEGMSTYDVDKLCYEFIKDNHAIASCLGYCGYPNATCISVNDTVIHGIPSRKNILKDGDLVSVDITLELDGYVSDSTHTYEIGNVSKEVHLLNEVTRKALYNAIDAASLKGARLYDIARAVESTVRPYHYGIVEDYCGHGVGFSIHEDPLVFNYVNTRYSNKKLREGLVIAIEPMINMGDKRIKVLDDGWTVKTVDGSVACHWEHTVAITEDGLEIMT